MLQRHAGVSLPGRVARDSTFHRKAACQAPASSILIWSKVADARTETSGDPLESRLSVFSPVVYLSMPFNCWPAVLAASRLSAAPACAMVFTLARFYAAEFFANLFPGKGPLKRRKKFLTALEQLQAGLGDLNDIVVDGNLITGMGAHRSSRKRVFAAGLLMGREDARIDAAMATATKAYTELAKVKPFWA